jgi:hypothetical protein
VPTFGPTARAGALCVLSMAGCGARSELNPEVAGSGGAGGASVSSSTVSASSSAVASSSSQSSSSSGPPCHGDAECDDGVGCTVDTCQPTGCFHQANDQACDDGIACTTDTCQPDGCSHEPDNQPCDDGLVCTLDYCDPVLDCQHPFTDAGCDDGIACTTDTCDQATDSCVHLACDSMCDDGTFCNGVERCDTALGCTSGPPACELGLTCSMDGCAENTQQCFHVQAGGCVPPVHLLVVLSTGALVSVSPYSGALQTIAAPSGGSPLDVAVLGGRWFVIDPGSLVELVPMSNQVKKSFPAPQANSLGAGPDGKLYAASQNVYRLDPDTGAAQTLGALPAGYSSSGDIAFLGAKMYVSTDGPCGGALVEFDPATGASTILGGDGLGCVYGLAAAGGTMFILNCDGKIGTFDPVTGEVRVLSTTGITAYGADVLP